MASEIKLEKPEKCHTRNVNGKDCKRKALWKVNGFICCGWHRWIWRTL